MPPLSPVIPSTTDRHSVRPATQAAPSVHNTGYEKAHTGIIPPPLIAKRAATSTHTRAADKSQRLAPERLTTENFTRRMDTRLAADSIATLISSITSSITPSSLSSFRESEKTGSIYPGNSFFEVKKGYAK